MKQETRDHVPSKVLLDRPFPENLPVVLSCYSCNQDFSLDEEYFACIIECMKHKTTEPENLSREKVKQIFKKSKLLKQRIEESKVESKENVLFQIEADRFEKVITKLAKGHVKYEFGEPQINKPNYIEYIPLANLNNEQLDRFLEVENSSIEVAPEIGSRAFNRVFATNEEELVQEKWIEVQKGSYSYLIEEFWNGKKVKFVISEFLAVEVGWIDDEYRKTKENNG